MIDGSVTDAEALVTLNPVRSLINSTVRTGKDDIVIDSNVKSKILTTDCSPLRNIYIDMRSEICGTVSSMSDKLFNSSFRFGQ